MMDADRLIAHLQRGADALRPLTANDYRDNPQRCDQMGQVAYDAMVLVMELLEREAGE